MITTQLNEAAEWATVAQAARAVQAGRRTIYNAIRDGSLRAAAVNERGDLRIHRDWLRDWLERRTAVVAAR
jgi:excisionase family DNA binding protein